jgi:hypothetical protein
MRQYEIEGLWGGRNVREWPNSQSHGRSRLRICRGWALNAVLIAVALNLFIWIRLSRSAVAPLLSLFGAVTILLFALASWYTWKKLTVTEYRKVKEQAAFLVGAPPDEQTAKRDAKQVAEPKRI